ncbi:MAG: spermidine synthase [Deltaproteobacteria bacterium]
MKKPLAKKILSYFTDVLLESTSSDFNEVLEIYLSKGRFQLCTSGAIYSFEDKYINFFETFKKIDWKKVKIEKVLLLGLGLASVPQMLEKKFRKKFEFHLVEIDDEIIRLAHDYILNDLNSQFYIYEMDAEIFCEITEEKFDLIIIDIFENNKVPIKFETIEFLEKTKDMLSNEGVILYNRLNIDKETKETTTQFYHEIFEEVFPDSKEIFIKTNIILSNRKDIYQE